MNDKDLDDLVELLADKVNKEAERQRENHATYPNLEWIRWITIGMMISNEKFLLHLNETVHLERAFNGNKDAADAALLVVMGCVDKDHDARLRYKKEFLEKIGVTLKPGEKFFGAVLRILMEEDKENWARRLCRVKALKQDAMEAIAKLASLAMIRTPSYIVDDKLPDENPPPKPTEKKP